jgi:hypothetical protein
MGATRELQDGCRYSADNPPASCTTCSPAPATPRRRLWPESRPGWRPAARRGSRGPWQGRRAGTARRLARAGRCGPPAPRMPTANSRGPATAPWGGTGTDLAGVLGEGDVAEVVRRLDAPAGAPAVGMSAAWRVLPSAAIVRCGRPVGGWPLVGQPRADRLIQRVGVDASQHATNGRLDQGVRTAAWPDRRRGWVGRQDRLARRDPGAALSRGPPGRAGAGAGGRRPPRCRRSSRA